MPHVYVRLFPGRTEQQKREFAQRIVEAGKQTLGTSEGGMSVAIEEIPKEQWEEQVYKPLIVAKPELLYKKPGYKLENGEFTSL